MHLFDFNVGVRIHMPWFAYCFGKRDDMLVGFLNRCYYVFLGKVIYNLLIMLMIVVQNTIMA